ncbi:efflux RND transporter permease subunit [Tumebacillus sp. ITR2]|uniref:Efflux RND transporter permease subunit n=1 Tax=Tumebacillus amylolyticus TaxID=2801339 RepID=A0ABS1JFH0_9BACL|nr:efflux RND transporter permease subunit [Tumebacillus amylolyticus]MBL0389032.1 efflux RND transporter permease subunit [Tumebacillus amylolyticus]
MKKLTWFSMKNAGLIFMVILLIFGGGLYSVKTMKMEQLPNVDIPYLSATAVYPGATPEQVLEDVAKPMETQLATVSGVKNLYVTSMANAAYVTLEFEMSKSMDDAEKDVNTALSKVQFPDGVKKPEVAKQGPTSDAIYTFAVDGGGADQATVQQFIEQKLQPSLQAVNGVSKIEVDGSADKKMFVKIDPDKLKEHNLTLDKVKQALLANNVSAPTGSVTIDGKSMNVQVGKQLTSIDDVKNVNLILVEQNMNGITDAFKSIGDGMGQLGSAVGTMGQGMGSLAQGQALMQQEIQIMGGINQLSAQMLQDQAALQKAATPQEQQPLQAKLAGEQAKITELQGNLTKIQDALKATGESSQKLMEGMKSSSGQKASAPDANSAKAGVSLSSLKLSDIADVTYEVGDAGSYTRLNSKPAVVAGVYPAIGANTVDVVKGVQDKLDALTLPDGYSITKLRDNSVEVKKSVDSMLREAIFGALLAALVTLAFLRNLRSTIVALLSIPLSILVTMIVMKYMDYSLNMMTLAGVAVAVGRVVDDSIVVIENIYRRIQTSSKEDRNASLVMQATGEVSSAITSSTVTTIAVFGPLAFVPGIVGKFFAPFAWSVVIALAFSLLIAVTVVPLMSRLFLLNLKPVEHREGPLQRGYQKLLHWSLGHKTLIIILCLALLGGTGLLSTQIPKNFFPAEKAVYYNYTADLPVGASLDATNKVALEMEQIVQDTKAVTDYQTTVHAGSVRVRATLKEDTDGDAFESAVREKTKAANNFGDGINTAISGKSGITGGGDLFLVVNGPDLDTIKKAADEMKKTVEGVANVADVKTNLEGGRPQVSITVDDAKAAEKGINPVMIMGAVRDMLSGSSVTNVTIDGKTTELNLGLKVDGLDNTDKIAAQLLTNMAGEEVKIGDVAKVEQKNGASSIQRLNQQEYVSISGKITDSNTSGVQANVEAELAKLNVPAGVTYYFEGESKAMADGFTNMALAIGVSIALVYMVMMVAFGEMLAPLAILFSLPFIFVGSIAGLYLTNESLGMPAMVGILMLIGIVVTNAIVLIDRVMQNRAKGMNTHDSLLEAGSTRIRPILMTAVATIGALVPLAISSDGGLISRSLAIVVISGLTTSTLLTLLVVPIAYTILDNIRFALFGKRKEKAKVKAVEA